MEPIRVLPITGSSITGRARQSPPPPSPRDRYYRESKENELKMACWCETNDKEKTKSIADAEARISDLTTKIEELTASSARLNTEIKNLEKEVAENQSALDKAIMHYSGGDAPPLFIFIPTYSAWALRPCLFLSCCAVLLRCSVPMSFCCPCPSCCAVLLPMSFCCAVLASLRRARCISSASFLACTASGSFSPLICLCSRRSRPRRSARNSSPNSMRRKRICWSPSQR